MKVFYCKQAGWEMDFFICEFFNPKNYENTNVEFLFYTGIHDFQSFVYDKNETYILIINTAIHLNDALSIKNIMKPQFVFFLSDEDGYNEGWLSLAKDSKGFFHQYYHPNYNYPSNCFQIPLGYVESFLNQRSILYNANDFIKPVCQRTIEAAFVGTLKADRQEMYDSVVKYLPNSKIIFSTTNWGSPQHNNIKPHELFDLYNNSIFVTVGRGNISLDCFRIYEAIAAGAIPVIVGSDEEINHTFYFQNNSFKYISGSSWTQVVQECRKMLETTDILQNIQDENIAWMKSQIQFVQDNIK